MTSKIITVYKYFDISTEKRKTCVKEIFKVNKLWFSSPKKVNDPFEFCFLPSFNASKQQKLKKCSELQKISYGLNQQGSMARAGILMKKQSSIKQWEQRNLRNLREGLDSRTCLCCFSKIANDILMWSHYANGHKGICICFSYKSKEHEGFFSKMHNVKYSENNSLPKFNFYKESLQNFKKKVLLAKARRWKYEKECRGIAIDSQEGYKIMPKGVIDSIILGRKFRSRNLKFIKEIKKVYNGPLKIYKMKSDPTKYRLVVVSTKLAINPGSGRRIDN